MAYTRTGDRELTLEQLANRVVWVKALLSGDYNQTQGQLRKTVRSFEGCTSTHTTGWCCLGVGGHVLEPDADFIREGSQRGMLPDSWAQDKLGLLGSIAGTRSDQAAAAGWNDSFNYSFEQIADRVALATEKHQPFDKVNTPPELKDEEPGAYARDWLASKV